MFDFFKNKKEKNEIFLALSLQEAGGEAYLLQYNQALHSVVVLGRKGFSFSNAWERLIEDVDEVLYGLEQESGQKAKKCIVFVYSHLVDIDKKEIREPYEEKIRAVSEELGLETLGFMEYHEVLSSYFSKNGSGQLNSVLCEIDGSLVTIFVYRNGHLDLIKTINKTTDYVETIEKELTELSKTKTLPLRVILYGIGSLEPDAATFMSKKWPSHVFVQLPKIEVVEDRIITEALIDGLKCQLLTDGAVVHSAVAVVDKIADEKITEEGTANGNISSLGFVVGKDINEEKPTSKFEPLKAAQVDAESSFMPSPTPFIKEKKSPFKKINFSAFRLKSVLVALVGLILIGIGIYSILNYFHKASVTLLYDTKPISKEMSVSGASLLVKSQSSTIQSSDSLETTGVKFVGEKASGEASVLNKNNDQVTIPKGATLIGPNNLKFITESEVKVASASEQLTSDGNVLTVTGKAKVDIVASEIGEEYNIGKDTKFEIQNVNFPVVAQSTKALTGGSKKEVRTASRDDFDKLRKRVLAKIKSETSNKVKNENGSQIIDQLTTVKITKENFSKEIAEEAGELSLESQATVKYYMIPLEEARKTLATKLAKSIPSDQTIDNDAISFTIKKAKLESGKPTLILRVKGLPRQNVDIEAVKKSLIGKSVDTIKEISSQYEATGYEYKIETELPLLKSRLPFFTKNLDLRIQTIR